MKTSLACAYALSLAAVFPASATALYSNGPVNGASASWNITSSSDVATNSFTVSSASIMTGFDFATWNSAGQVISTVNWAIGTTAFGNDVALGTSGVSSVFDFSGTDSANLIYPYDVETNTVSGLNVGLSAGTTYWLTLYGAAIPGTAAWDQNYGSSAAQFSTHGFSAPISSETFDINGGSSSTPEPASLGLLGGGILVMLGAFRRRKAV